MNERERLIELLQESQKYLNERDCDECRGHADCSRCTDRDIADYLLENGVVVLPCKIGDTVYEITKDCLNCNYLKDYSDTYTCEKNPEGNLFEFDYAKDCNYKISKTTFTYSLIPYIGDYVFLTNEEAEQALKCGNANE